VYSSLIEMWLPLISPRDWWQVDWSKLHTLNLLTSKKQEITPDTWVTSWRLAVNQSKCGWLVINQTAVQCLPRGTEWRAHWHTGLPGLWHSTTLGIPHRAKHIVLTVLIALSGPPHLSLDTKYNYIRYYVWDMCCRLKNMPIWF